MCGIAVVWGGVRLRAASPDETASSMHRSSEDGSTQLAELTGACVELMVSTERAAEPSTMLENEVKAVLAQRGPDSSGALVVKPMDSYPPATLLGCTLGLRNEVAPQPVTTSDGAALLWNGEIFGGSIPVKPGASDTIALAAALECANNDAAEVMKVMSALSGPWATIYYKPGHSIWFGRDSMGRRSLLLGWPVNTTSDGALIIASSAPASCQTNEYRWLELPVTGLFELRLHGSDSGRLLHHPWAFGHARRHLREAAKCVPPGTSVVGQGWTGELPAEQDEETVAGLLAVLDEAVRVRVTELPPPPVPGSAMVGVLFSGGIDCVVIAALAARHVDPKQPIELINVSFAREENDRNIASATESEPRPYDTPDRRSAVAALGELRRLAPSREWTLIEVNCTLVNAMRSKGEIMRLMFPAATVMDFTIGAALFFAARGVGQQHRCSLQTTSAARVLLSGLGADEQLVGYKGRHRTRFARGGWTQLNAELALDIGRLWLRNLGRDDRLISSHGREARFPYLDEAVMEYLANCPLWKLADLRLPDGVGDKRVLRVLALKLGLSASVAGMPKRAIQFGSRSSKFFKCNSDGSTHVDQAVLSPEFRSDGANSKRRRKPRGIRRAAGRDRGTQYPGKKDMRTQHHFWFVSIRLAAPQEHCSGRWRVRIGQRPRLPKAICQSSILTDAGHLKTEIEAKPQKLHKVEIWPPGALDGQSFIESYLRRNRPVVLDGPLPSSWRCVADWVLPDGSVNFEGMLTCDLADSTVPVDVSTGDNSGYSANARKEMQLRDFVIWWKRYNIGHGATGNAGSSACTPSHLAARREGGGWCYLRDFHLARDHPVAASQLYQPPYPLSNAPGFDWLNNFWTWRSELPNRSAANSSFSSWRAWAVSTCQQLPRRVDDYRFCYAGPAGSWTPLHHDVLRSYSWSTNICGKKRWLLFPPEATQWLTNANGCLIADARPQSASPSILANWPELPRAWNLMEDIVQTAGQTIFVPSGWHHQVHNEADTISINHNWFCGPAATKVHEFLTNELAATRAALDDLKPGDNKCESHTGHKWAKSASPAKTEPANAALVWEESCQQLLGTNSALDLREWTLLLVNQATDALAALCSDAPLKSRTRRCWDQYGGTVDHLAQDDIKVIRDLLSQLLNDEFIAVHWQAGQAALAIQACITEIEASCT